MAHVGIVRAASDTLMPMMVGGIAICAVGLERASSAPLRSSTGRSKRSPATESS